ncbi:MFS transporter [Halopseudomonas salegens]|uniref:Predicted arabinose efflux permease, MFS family n=1 Tax=Halopseudomonas salegens TaxID=1434072 RepID=A0A1H2HQ82_9GAMM|nr:MFS transporter [Halopseudomonas salegens]SDU34012.1 Predicted arabinose efflux permease, MFS family [Halopseudomonas salegens]
MKRLQAAEKHNLTILVLCQIIFMITSIGVLTLSGVVGFQLSPDPAWATLPIAAMMFGTLLTTLPASLLMKAIGRRAGFMLGTAVGGLGGSVLCVLAINQHNFWLFALGNLLLGLYQGFAMYHRFAAADVTRLEVRSKAIAWVMAAGVAAAFLGPWNTSLSQQLFPDQPLAGPYLVIAILTGVAVVLLSRLRVPASGEPQAGEVQRPMARIARQPAFILAVSAAAIGYAVMLMVMTATPLAMSAQGLEMSHVAQVMQWHVLGMFAPSFVTGHLIARFGLLRLLLAGCMLFGASVLVALSGNQLGHFVAALVLLGIGWNFLFIGGSSLLTQCHNESERGKVQGINDLLIFSLVTLASLLAGTLLHSLGWIGLNLAMLPAIGVVLALLLVYRQALRIRQTG